MTLVKFKERFPSFLDEVFGGDMFETPTNSSWMNSTVPAVNVKENETNFELELAVPGMKKEDFKIELNENILGISSESQEEHVEEKEKYSRREFSYRTFRRTFTLPEHVDESKISASYVDGVLKISIPKKEEEKQSASRLISIN